MGFLNKIKNMFFEEEEIEIEEKPIAKKVELPKKEKKLVEDISINEEQFEDENEEIEVGETYTPKDKNNGFKFPVLLEDNLIEEEIKIEKEPIKSNKKENQKNIVKEESIKEEIEDRNHPYNNSYTRDLNSADYSLIDRKQTSNSFRPSPIISPIYGVLDKNYKKEEIRDKKDAHPTTFSFSNDKVDLDTVRQKAFGENIVTDIENDIEEDSEDRYDNDYEENTTLDMTDTNIKPVVEKVTVGDAEEYFEDLGLEYNIDYTDSSKEKASSKRITRTKKLAHEETSEEVEEETDNSDIEVTENVTEVKKTRRSKIEANDDIEIEDNLFDLIDSMYDEGE